MPNINIMFSQDNDQVAPFCVWGGRTNDKTECTSSLTNTRTIEGAFAMHRVCVYSKSVDGQVNEWQNTSFVLKPN